MDEERAEGEVREETGTADTREGGPEGATVDIPAADAAGERPTEGAGTAEAGTGAAMGTSDPFEGPAAQEPREGAANPEGAAGTVIPPLPSDGGEDTGTAGPWRSASRWVAAHVPATVAIVACALAAIAVVAVALSAGAPAKLTRSVTYDGISVGIPGSWKVEGAADDALETPFYVYPDFPGLLMVQGMPMTGPLDDRRVQEFSEGLEETGFTVVGVPKRTTVDGRTAYRLDTTGEIEGVRYRGGIVLVAFDGCTTGVAGMTALDGSPSSKATVQTVLDSIRVVSNPEKATVTFMNGGTVVSSQELSFFGSAAVETPATERPDAELTGWKVVSGSATVADLNEDTYIVSGITGDVSCEAEWSPLWEVTFTSGTGNILKIDHVADGQAATPPVDPTRSGYDFDGWEGDFANVTQDTVVSAKWVKQATLGERNALAKAKSYLSHSSFSYKGLIHQLEFEGYSAEEATYGADHSGADWNEQAAKKAASYMKHSSYSRSGLIHQLEFEGFTTEQAEYGATSVGF